MTPGVDSAMKLSAAVKEAGMLPFFSCGIEGLSVEELTVPGMLFADMDGGMGAWDWKGPVIREMDCTYGKFFNRKAGFVSLELLPHFLNRRRSIAGKRIEDADQRILEMIRSNESMMASELRLEIFGSRSRKGQSVEGNLTRLQMGGYVVIADFEYSYTKQGEQYGWGKARYTTPEALFGPDIARPGCDGQESFEILYGEMCKRHPAAPRRALARLIG